MVTKLKIVIIVSTICFFAACSSASAPYTYIRKGFDWPGIKKLAVFPFYNNTKIAGADKIVTGIFISGLVQTGRFKVEFPGNVKCFLVNERIIVRTSVDLDTIKLMGKRLGVQAVILGQVEEFTGVDDKKRNVDCVVSISARMVDTMTGEILWMTQYRKTGEDYTIVIDFGRVRSVSTLVKKVVAEMIKTMP